MKTCANCGNQAPDEALACPNCRSALPDAAAPLPPPKTSSLAIIAFILAVAPFPLFFTLWVASPFLPPGQRLFPGLFPCLTPILGLVLGLIARDRIKKRPHELKGWGVANAACNIVYFYFIILIIGIVAALAGGILLKFLTKSKQDEAQNNLNAIFAAQVSYYGENKTYAPTFQALNWAPEGKNHYAYFLPGQEIENLQGAPSNLPPGVTPAVSREGFTAVAVGNIDADTTPDVWTINDKKELRNVVNDVEQ